MSNKPVQVLFFAGARDEAGCAEYALELPEPLQHNVASVRALLFERFPSLAPRARSLRFAVNGSYARDDEPVVPGDELAVIPPVAGG